jgi:hypothetical protein
VRQEEANMAIDDRRRGRPDPSRFREEDEGGDMRGPYGGAGDYGGSYTAGGFTGAGFGGGYYGYDLESDLGGYGRGMGGPVPGGYGGQGDFTGEQGGFERGRARGVDMGPAYGRAAFPRGNPDTYDYYRTGAGPSRLGRPNYAGRGPRGYTRSDARIEEDICEALTRHPEIDATDVAVTVRSGVVTLEGTVDDGHAKRLAEDLAARTAGVRDVDNRLRRNPGGP